MSFCYWSVTYDSHSLIMANLIASARKHGVKEDFHIWADKDIPGAVSHPCGSFNKDLYLFKFKFLLNEVSKLDYDYFVWLDADNYFVRHPGDGTYDRLIRSNNWFVQLESECTSPFVKRGDWWGCPIKWYPLLLRYHGVKSKKIYNTNAGFWMVRKTAIREFYSRAMAFHEFCRSELHLVNFTEEPPLAFLGHFVDDIELNTLSETSSVWASDWTGIFKTNLPNGDYWDFEDYMSGEKRRVNPAITHCMRAKGLLATPQKS